MQVGFYFDQNGCIGCYSCVAACRSEQLLEQNVPDLIKLPAKEIGTFPKVRLAQRFMTCFHCTQAPCVEACPEGLFSKRAEDGAVVVDRVEDCSGCGLCVDACPYGAPVLVGEDRPVVYKCDLCGGRRARGLTAACAACCPVGALGVGPMDKLIALHGERRVIDFFPDEPRISASIIFGE